MDWKSKRVIVTGGAGFIGGALVDRLLSLGAKVTPVDKIFLNPYSEIAARKLERLNLIFKKHGVRNDLRVIDLATNPETFELVCAENDVVFHLSALFGGREFVNERQADCARMFAVDHNTIESACRGGIKTFHYASSACVYPDTLQKDPSYLLKEDDALSTGEGWKSADNLYGFAKLMGELQCKVYHEEKGLETSVCRYLTVYGEGELDASHAIAALVEKALDRQDPFQIWGSGKQQRGFTYVDDIVSGSILAAELVRDGTPINLGWDKRYSMDEVAQEIFQATDWKPHHIHHDRNKPEGPFSRALDISRARFGLGWTPKVDLAEGLKKTVEWHKELRTFGPLMRA